MKKKTKSKNDFNEVKSWAHSIDASLNQLFLQHFHRTPSTDDAYEMIDAPLDMIAMGIGIDDTQVEIFAFIKGHDCYAPYEYGYEGRCVYDKLKSKFKDIV